jgi:hypothetical protein
MRILFLTILFLAPLYYFSSGNAPEPESDSIALKVSAPDRIERILTVEPTKKAEPQESSEPTTLSAETDQASDEEAEVTEERAPAGEDEEGVEEVHMSDIEESWNGELKQILNRLEPAEGDDIHQAYLQEQENYRVMVDSLMSEKTDKTSKEASLEIEQMIQQLDHNHQERLKEILGPHFEAVRDSYDQYMETATHQE